jgi:hypothetical protein
MSPLDRVESLFMRTQQENNHYGRQIHDASVHIAFQAPLLLRVQMDLLNAWNQTTDTGQNQEHKEHDLFPHKASNIAMFEPIFSERGF